EDRHSEDEQRGLERPAAAEDEGEDEGEAGEAQEAALRDGRDNRPEERQYREVAERQGDDAGPAQRFQVDLEAGPELGTEAFGHPEAAQRAEDLVRPRQHFERRAEPDEQRDQQLGDDQD